MLVCPLHTVVVASLVLAPYVRGVPAQPPPPTLTQRQRSVQLQQGLDVVLALRAQAALCDGVDTAPEVHLIRQVDRVVVLQTVRGGEIAGQTYPAALQLNVALVAAGLSGFPFKELVDCCALGHGERGDPVAAVAHAGVPTFKDLGGTGGAEGRRCSLFQLQGRQDVEIVACQTHGADQVKDGRANAPAGPLCAFKATVEC